MILNPRSLRCVRATGRVARDLLRHGNIGELNIGYYAAAAAPPMYRRQTVRAPRRRDHYGEIPSLAAAFGAAPSRGGIPALGALFAAPAAPAAAAATAPRRRAVAVPELTGAHPCPPGTTRNPQTRRCIKLSGRTYKKLVGAPVAPPSPPSAPALHMTIPRRYGAAAARTSSEESVRLPVGSAAPGPIGDRRTVLEWAALNCENTRDPLTKAPFATASHETLQQMVRTHDGVCTLGPALNRHVYAAHKVGQVATLPADPSTHMTLDDFKALRNVMRREDPGYKIPGRRHQPPPPSWQLYIASDRRSGPDFASVMYVDTTKGRMTPAGIEYPPESVRVDLGFIPVSVGAGAMCSPKTVSELIIQLAEKNKLLVPVAGGWRPVGGFPFKKSHWEVDRSARISRLCQDLAKVLASPI